MHAQPLPSCPGLSALHLLYAHAGRLTCMYTILCSNSLSCTPATTYLQGIVTVPLSDLMSKNSIRETYKLEGAKNGHLALDLKFVSVLHGS